MPYFPHLQATLPRVKIAEEIFDMFLADMPLGTTNEDVANAVAPLNEALREALEAFVLDTDTANSRTTLESVYLPIPDGCFTHGGLTWQRLNDACESGRAP
jgi:hypothetical protein